MSLAILFAIDGPAAALLLFVLAFRDATPTGSLSSFERNYRAREARRRRPGRHARL